MSELHEDFKAIREEQRERLEPLRFRYAILALKEADCAISYALSLRGRIDIYIGKHAERPWVLWPYTGWWQGNKKQGRGLASLLEEIKKVKEDKS